MSDIKYQKIELHSTYNLVNDRKIIEQEREAVQKLMTENQIRFSIEIDQKEAKDLTGRYINVQYVLNLIVRKDDIDKVVELLDKAGNFGYYIDFDDTYDSNEKTEESENQEVDFFESLEESDEIVVKNQNDNPITMFCKEDNENLNDYNIKMGLNFKSIDYNVFSRVVMKLFLAVLYMIVMIPQIVGIVYGIKELQYEIATSITVLIVIEIPIFVWIYKILNKKNN